MSRIPDGRDSESFRGLQGSILAEYEAMAAEMEFHVIDATVSMEEQQRRARQTVECLGEVLRTGVLRSAPRVGPKGSPKGSDGIATTAPVL